MKRLNFVVWMVVLLLFTAPTMEINADTAPARVEMTVPGLRKSRPAKRPGIERAPPPAQLPRVTRLMALAIKYQGMISRGELCHARTGDPGHESPSPDSGHSGGIVVRTIAGRRPANGRT
jgi:hypothetical protein